MIIQIHYWKTTGKFYMSEIISIDDLESLESKIKIGFIAITYIVEKEGFEQPYRVYIK